VILDANKSLYRVQSYSPNFRSFHGRNGTHKVGDVLLDVRNFAKVTDEKDKSLICISDAANHVKNWLEFAQRNVAGLRKTCGMARLELTFKSNNLDYELFDQGVDTLIRTFHQSTKVFSGSLVANLAEISLLSFEGISKALFIWFSPHCSITEPKSWNIFSEVWSYLTHFATHFFDGRSSFLTNKLYSPRLGYIFSRPFINPSWTGINEALKVICGEGNLEKLRRIWYDEAKMLESYERAIVTELKSSIVNLDKKFDIKINSLLELLSAQSRKSHQSVNDAVACSHCQTICSSTDKEKDSWVQHPCERNNLIDLSNFSSKRNIDIRREEFDLYLSKVTKLLSQSQMESLSAIMSTNQNCFLTGVAGSGKSFLFKVFYPMMIRLYGFSGILITASTNIAASNVFGQTLHKFLGLTVSDVCEDMIYEMNAEKLEKTITKHIENLNFMCPVVIQSATLCKVLVIDEVGMIDSALINFIDIFFRKIKNSENDFGGVRMILIGDVMQLEPFQPRRHKANNKTFYQHHTFKRFFVAYLRSNMRQQDDAPFLNALNKIRVGDGTAADYLHDSISKLNNTSKSTLQLARDKKDLRLSGEANHRMLNRIQFYGLQNSRIYTGIKNNSAYDREIQYIDNRIFHAKDTGYTDLIVCHDNIENTIYTDLKNSKQKEKISCQSVDKRVPPYSPIVVETWEKEMMKHIQLKLLPVLVIYKGMRCRATYQTDNQYVCTNTLVIIEDFTVDNGKVTHIDIISCEKNIKVRIIPVSIKETFQGKGQLVYEISRTQFGLMDSAGLVPWNLQCLTVTGNIFYDNSRSSLNRDSTKGVLYTIISRVKKKEQFSYLHTITAAEIGFGVSERAKNFDDKYRLKDNVIFDMIPTGVNPGD
jgi:PIF1-like helicase